MLSCVIIFFHSVCVGDQPNVLCPFDSSVHCSSVILIFQQSQCKYVTTVTITVHKNMFLSPQMTEMTEGFQFKKAIIQYLNVPFSIKAV